MEADRLVVEIQTLHNEIIQLRSNLNDLSIKSRSHAPVNGVVPMQPDGQSRLNQWKQGNSVDGTATEKAIFALLSCQKF